MKKGQINSSGDHADRVNLDKNNSSATVERLSCCLILRPNCQISCLNRHAGSLDHDRVCKGASVGAVEAHSCSQTSDDHRLWPHDSPQPHNKEAAPVDSFKKQSKTGLLLKTLLLNCYLLILKLPVYFTASYIFLWHLIFMFILASCIVLCAKLKLYLSPKHNL